MAVRRERAVAHNPGKDLEGQGFTPLANIGSGFGDLSDKAEDGGPNLTEPKRLIARPHLDDERTILIDLARLKRKHRVRLLAYRSQVRQEVNLGLLCNPILYGSEPAQLLNSLSDARAIGDALTPCISLPASPHEVRLALDVSIGLPYACQKEGSEEDPESHGARSQAGGGARTRGSRQRPRPVWE